MHTRILVLYAAFLLLAGGIRPVSAQLPPENVDLFAYSPESNLIAINVRIPDASDGRGQSIAEIYDTVSGQYLGLIPAQETGFIYLQFNATGDRLTTVTADNFVDTWDLSTFSWTEPSLPGGAFEGGPIAWNPQNDWLAASLARQIYVSSADAPHPIRFGDRETTSTPTDMRWSPDGKLLAISTYDARTETQHLTIWDTFGADPMSTGPVLRITGHRIGRLDWKPDGTAIAAPTADGIVIYDAETGEIIQRIMTDEPLGYVYEIRWSPDGRQIAIGANDILWIWDVATGAMLAHHVMPQDVKEIAWLPNGQVLHNGVEIGLAINGTSIEGYVLPAVPPAETPTFTPTFTPTHTATFTPSPVNTATPTFTPTHTPTSDTTCTVTATNPATLVSAITAANANGASPDTICLETESTYAFFSAANNNALPSVTTPITIIGNGAVLERGSGAPNFRFFNVTAAGALTLDDLTLRNGNASGNNGGAILNAGTLTLNDVTLTGNTARYGGAVHSSGTLTIDASTIMSNSANENAGAVYVNSGTVTITDTVFESNSSRYGSGLYINNGTASLTDVTMRGNSANEQGAGVYLRAGTLTIDGGLFESNTARFGNGVYVDAGIATISGVVMQDNIATEEGAAIYNRTGTLSVADSTFTANRARYGAAISNRGPITVVGSTFADNVAQENGGALYNTSSAGGNRVENSCFTGNTARFGGAVFSSAANFNARDNWWGSDTGPTSAMVNNNVQTSPFLTGGCPN